MKTKYFIYLVIAIAVGLTLISCNENREDAGENVKKANQDMLDTQAQYEKEWQQYKTDADSKIKINQKTIDDFKVAMKTTSSKFKAKYENKVLTLEQKNIELKKMLNEYRYEGKEKWEEFKKGFNKDVDIVEKELKDIFAKKD